MFGTIPGWTDEDGRQYVTCTIAGRDGETLRMIGSLNADDVGRRVEVWDRRPEMEGASVVPTKRQGAIEMVIHMASYQTQIKLVGVATPLVCSSTAAVRFIEERDPTVVLCARCGWLIVRARTSDNMVIMVDPEPVADPDLERDLAILGGTPIDEEPIMIYGETSPGPRWRRHKRH